MRRFLPLTFTLTLTLTAFVPLITACGPKTTSSSKGDTTAARRAGPTKCPTLTLSPKLRRQKTLTRRIRKMACRLQACYDAAPDGVNNTKATVQLSVTIDQGGRIEAIRLKVRDLPGSVTACIRSKVWRWDFDIRDDPYTYGPFKVLFSP